MNGRRLLCYIPTKHYEIPEYEYLNLLIVRRYDVFTELVFELDFRKWSDLLGEENGVWGLGTRHFWQREKHLQR